MASSPRLCSSRPPAPEIRQGRVRALLAFALLIAAGCAQSDPPAGKDEARASGDPSRCTPSSEGYVRARLQGAIDAEIDWSDPASQCRGVMRPSGDGVRFLFKGTVADDPHPMLLLIGAGPLRAGESTRNVPANVTVIREGAAEVFATQGDDRCALDEIAQVPVETSGGKLYRVTGRGYCTQPARAVAGDGAVLLSRFDFVSIVDFSLPDGGN
jgi:hypothetical protein